MIFEGIHRIRGERCIDGWWRMRMGKIMLDEGFEDRLEGGRGLE